MKQYHQPTVLQRRMKGVALVTVLFILTIMTVTVTWLSEEVLLSLRRSENIRDSEQAWQTLIGSESWARGVLLRDSRESATDHPGEKWNQLGQGVTVEQGKLLTVIEDMQGRFNLNNLLIDAAVPLRREANKELPLHWSAAFRRLLIALELNPALSDAVLDWLDPDQNVRGTAGAEDIDYLGMEPPYRAADRGFAEVSELLRVKGFEPAMVAKLAPYVTALPATDVRININTAPALLLRILGKDLLSEAESEQLVNDRPVADGYTVEEFLQHDMMAGEQDTAILLIGNSSSYFLIRSSTEVGRARKNIHSLVERTNETAAVIKRSPVL